MHTGKSLTVWILPKAYHKFSLWAEMGGKKHREMTSFGRVEIEDGDLVVTDAYMIKHVGDSASVDGDEDDIIRLMMELHEQGIPTEELRCWTHSHPGTGPSATFLSGTDEDNIDRYLTGEFLVCIVFDSKGGAPYCRVEFRAGENERVGVEANLEMYIPYLSEEEEDKARADYVKMSSARPVTRGRVYVGNWKGKGSKKNKPKGPGSNRKENQGSITTVRYPAPPKVSADTTGSAAFGYTGVYTGSGYSSHYGLDDEDDFDWDLWGGLDGYGSVSAPQSYRHEPEVPPMKRLPPPRVTDVRFAPKDDGTVEVEWSGDDGSSSPEELLTEQSDDAALAALSEADDSTDETVGERWNREYEQWVDNQGNVHAVPAYIGRDDTDSLESTITERDDLPEPLADAPDEYLELFEREVIEMCHQIATGDIERDEAIQFLVDDYHISKYTAEAELDRFLGVGVQ
jgi:hypothetical protein